MSVFRPRPSPPRPTGGTFKAGARTTSGGIAGARQLPDTDTDLLLTSETGKYPDIHVIAATGALDMSTADTLDAEVRAAEATDVQRIIIDLSGVTFMDSTGLRLLLQAHTRSQADSNRLRLIRGPQHVHRIFVLTNTDRKLPFLD